MAKKIKIKKKKKKPVKKTTYTGYCLWLIKQKIYTS